MQNLIKTQVDSNHNEKKNNSAFVSLKESLLIGKKHFNLRNELKNVF